jgi:thiol:disulfide interchange protein DsbG
MRHLIASAVLLLPAIAGAAPPLCALASSQPATGTTPPDADGQLATTAKMAEPILPENLVGLPFVNHIAASGATLSDMGVSHGMHGVFARTGDQLMIFQVVSDGEAAVAGAITEISAAQLMAYARENVQDLGLEHGLRTLLVRSGPQFQVYYVTPDGERVIPGVMWDANGTNITRKQIASVPGAVSSVVVAADPHKASSTQSVAALPLLEKTTAGSIGSTSAPHLWMLFDPQCVYSVRAFQMLQPYIASGRLRISVVPLSVLDYEDHGASTKAALALLSMPPENIVTAWQMRELNGVVSAAAGALLRTNMAIADAIHLTGTPTFVWRKADGSEGRFDGLPANADALLASVGN